MYTCTVIIYSLSHSIVKTNAVINNNLDRQLHIVHTFTIKSHAPVTKETSTVNPSHDERNMLWGIASSFCLTMSGLKTIASHIFLSFGLTKGICPRY